MSPRLLTRSIFLAALMAVACGAAAVPNFQNHYISLGSQDHSVAMASDSLGNVFILATITNGFGLPELRLVKTSPQGGTIASFDFAQGVQFGSNFTELLAVDPQGNVFVTCQFPLAAQIFKLEGGLTKVLATATLGSNRSTSANAITTDSSGNLYVVGNTWASNFPVTPGAYRTSPPLGTCPPNTGPNGWVCGVATLGFVTKYSNDLSRIIYATYYGSDKLTCQACAAMNTYATTILNAIAVNTSGAATVAGSSNAGYFGTNPTPNGVIARLSPDGSSVTASTTFGKYDGASINALAFDPSGNVLFAGVGGGDVTFPANSPQPTARPINLFSNGGFVGRFDAALQNLTAGAYLPHTYINTYGVTGVASDAEGNIWFTGVAFQTALAGETSQQEFPTGYFGALSGDGTAFLELTPTPHAGHGIVNLPGGGFGVLGLTDSFLLSSMGSQTALLTVTSTASNVSSGTIAPEELITLYGSGIGPSAALPGQVVNGVYTNSLGGYQVLFDGTPAPLLYATAGQLNVVAPQSIAGQQITRIQVTGPQGTVAFPLVYVAPQRPQVFSYLDQLGRTFAVARNQDGTTNSKNNPAQPGSVVAIWATGLYGTSSALAPADGELMFPLPPTYTFARFPVSVTLGVANSLDVVYASDSPGQILGITQINFQLPDPSFFPSFPTLNVISVWIGGVTSDEVELYTAAGDYTPPS